MPYHAWSELPITDHRAAALDALRSALVGCGFHPAAQPAGRSIVVHAPRGAERIEIHLRSSMGTGPAYWPKSTFQLAKHRYGGSPSRFSVGEKDVGRCAGGQRRHMMPSCANSSSSVGSRPS